ncbi:S8 family serine peptidase [Aeromicrobium terrae]|uniref:Peptidase S8/S53 domain-containing protein n=1 Tax=Aeromicrobium terrae TaxID=2498846 RepID=A0A5C8NHE1_9ACTN|nr:S8 family serine peptidase [Aeromicrobium terrae]TXL58080.1 hypothetical protein FHP06_12210 [Aeromicrobium terrae]
MPARRLAIVVTAVVAAVLTGALASPSSADLPTSEQGTSHVGPDVSRHPSRAVGLIVKTKAKQATGDLVARTQAAIGRRAKVASARNLTGRISAVRFRASLDGSSVLAAAKEVEKRSDVEWAIPDMVRRPFVTQPPKDTNDQYFSTLKHLWDNRSASTSLPSPWPNGGFSTRAPYIWRAPQGMGSGDVAVAVIDTGITSHPDLDDQRLPGYDFASAWSDPDYGSEPPDSQDPDGNPGWDSDPSDPGDWIPSNKCGFVHSLIESSWHGTHVAGIVAAEGDNVVGVVGVAPKVKIIPIRVVGRCGAIDSDILTAIEWATGGHITGVPDNPHPAKVVNLSLGAEDTASRVDKACIGYSDAATAARTRGAVIVAAAGNAGVDVRYSVPGACSGIIAVGASSSRGLRASYSNWGERLSFSAIGGDYRVDGDTYTVMSTYNTGTIGPVGPTYLRLEGTSMAAPMASAAAAILSSLGLDTAAKVEAGLRAALRTFPAYNAKYRDFFSNGKPWSELNCRWPNRSVTYACGDGILDLAQVQANISPPTVSGYYRVGQTLKASTGSWNASGRGLSYQWLSDNQPIDGATSSTYKARGWDLNHHLSVRITPKVSAFKPLAKTSAQTPALIQAKSTTSISLPTTISHTKRAYVSVTVKATGYWPTGELTVYDRDKKLLSVHLTSTSQHGTRTIKLPALAKGYHKITVQYGGTKYILPSTSPMKQIKSK